MNYPTSIRGTKIFKTISYVDPDRLVQVTKVYGLLPKSSWGTPSSLL